MANISWGTWAAALSIPVLAGTSLLYVPVATYQRALPKYHAMERRSGPMVPLNETAAEAVRVRELNQRFLAGEWVRVGFDRRALIWNLEVRASEYVEAPEFVDWGEAWWQPLVGLILGGCLLTCVMHRERLRQVRSAG